MKLWFHWYDCILDRISLVRLHSTTTNHAKQLSRLNAAVNYVLCDIVLNNGQQHYWKCTSKRTTIIELFNVLAHDCVLYAGTYVRLLWVCSWKLMTFSFVAVRNEKESEREFDWPKWRWTCVYEHVSFCPLNKQIAKIGIIKKQMRKKRWNADCTCYLISLYSLDNHNTLKNLRTTTKWLHLFSI